MGHITSKNYLDLQKRLELSPQGAPPSDALFKILELLFTKKEASLVSLLPLDLFNIKTAAKIWKRSEKETENILNALADKGLLVDIETKDHHKYILAPTMAGFFEFSLMRTDGKFDRKVLSELYYQYINVETDFMKEIFSVNPSIARTFIQEDVLPSEDELIILDYERASNVINTASCITVGTCYCRHKMEHMGKACNKPQDVCLTFNNTAKSLAKHGIAKKITKKEAFDVLNRCIKLGLVQVGDNVQNNVAWICNCCGCCCEALLAYKKFGYVRKINSNFLAKTSHKSCIKCGVCKLRCPVDAITLQDKFPVVDINKCIGCGVCVRFCAPKSLTMVRRKETMFVPKDSFERFVMSAIEQNKLQNFIFDNNQLWTSTLLRRFLGVLLALKPSKKLLLNKQFKSRYLTALAKRDSLYDPKVTDVDYSHPELKK